MASVYTYSLLPNHFHIVACIKENEPVISHFETVKKKKFDPLHHNLPDFIMERFSNFLNAYTKSINKAYNRKGALFLDYMKRSKVNKESHFTSFVFYTNKNAVHHGLTAKIGDWEHDAFASLVSNKPTKLLRDDVINWFGGKERFIQFHQQPVELKKINFIDC